MLVGSTDGYLYALDPCTLERIWSLNLRYPVGEAVVGDATGDGADDLGPEDMEDEILDATGDEDEGGPSTRDIAIVSGAAGLVLVAVGWFAVRSRRR